MKAVIHHDLGAGVRRLVEAASSPELAIAIVPANDLGDAARKIVAEVHKAA